MKNIKFINTITVITIILVATLLRLYKLGSFPALNADEAAIGYNAYCLLETGRDEHGNPWPIHFQSFNDYKPGLYVYLVMPFVKVLGLNEWSVRLPNALLGIASIYILYLLVKIINIKMENKMINDKLKMENIAAMLLAISPWHLHFSRGGWEVNTATFFILAGVYFFSKYISKKRFLFIVFCLLFFVLSMYTYHSARIITPLLVLGMMVIFWQEMDVRKNIRHLVIVGLVGILFIIPLILDFTKSDIISRATGVGLIADVGPIERTNEQRMEHYGFTSVILHNKLTNYGLTFLKNWGAHYHGLFLFVSGDTIQRNAVPETGQMYMFEIITVAFGLIFLTRIIYKQSLRLHQNSKFAVLVLYWLLVAPIPAALTFQSPHALRAQNMVIPLSIISAIGLTYIIEKINSLCHSDPEHAEGEESHSKITNIQYTIYNILLPSCCLLLATVISWSFFRYLHMYYLHMAKEYPYSSQYGVKELTSYLSKQQKEYINIVVTNKYDQPYILFLFYTKYPPEKFQKDHVLTKRDKYGFSTVESFGNFIFKSIDWDRDKLLYPDSLIIGSNEEIPNETNITKRIYGTNDYLYFKIVEN